MDAVAVTDLPIAPMRALAEWNAPADLIGVFTDIDDTLTTEGAITPDALDALRALRAAGLHVVPITGRPVGWSETFAASWPVDAIVAENGAVTLQRVPLENNGQNGLQRLLHMGDQLSKSYQQSEADRRLNYARMQEVLAHIEHSVPGAQRATDSPGRETDIAIDHSEFTHLPQAGIDQCVAVMQAAGMRATVSSIHINAWFGDHNKWEGARWFARQFLNRDLAAEMDRWVYVGDSTNDQIMFQHFTHSVGVANVARFVPQLKCLPRYVSPSERGAGFAEVARHVLAARNV